MKKLCQVSWPQTTDQKAEVRFEANRLPGKNYWYCSGPKHLPVPWPEPYRRCSCFYNRNVSCRCSTKFHRLLCLSWEILFNFADSVSWVKEQKWKPTKKCSLLFGLLSVLLISTWLSICPQLEGHRPLLCTSDADSPKPYWEAFLKAGCNVSGCCF